MNKRGGFVDLFILMVVAFIILVVSGLFIYIQGQTEDKLQDTLGQMNLQDTNGNNASVVIENTFGKLETTFSLLYWITTFLIFGMVISIFIGSYFVTTRPIVFVPYIIIVLVAVITSVGLSNAYEEIINTSDLQSTFLGFTGGNHFYLNLPVYIAIIGIVGGLIMVIRWGNREEGY